MKRYIKSSDASDRFDTVDAVLDAFGYYLERTGDVYNCFYKSIRTVNDYIKNNPEISERGPVTQNEMEEIADEIDEEYGFDIFDLL